MAAHSPPSAHRPGSVRAVAALAGLLCAAVALFAAPGAGAVLLPTPPLRALVVESRAASPSAASFAASFLEVANAYAAAHGDATRLSRANCVQAAPRAYMCSYLVTKPGTPARCHVIQARWTPKSGSTITVTLATTTPRCGSLREALRSLK